MTTQQLDSSNGPTYMMGRSESETRRLISASDLYGRSTRRLLEDAGIDEGMSVLDIGTGAGDVALMAAGMVGEKGRVVGVDRNPEILKTAFARAQAAGLDNVAFVAADAREPVPPLTPRDARNGDFDAVVGRFFLMYLPDPAQTIRSLAAHLGPGGIVAFQEFNMVPGSVVTHPPMPVWERGAGWTWEVARLTGTERLMGYKLRRVFLDAGLPEPTMELFSAVGGGPDWPGYETLAGSVRSMLPLIIELGIATEEEVDIDTLADRLRAETVEADGVVKAPDIVSAYARKA
jgi:ubiquinone/menaquinone biosynthesis C-methylase UbiE